MPIPLRDRQTILLSFVAVVAGLGLLAVATPLDGPGVGRIQLVIDPNTAPPEALAALPRLGPVLVGRIVEARAVAPFASLSDLDDRVRGIGPATIPILRPHLRVGPGPASFTDH